MEANAAEDDIDEGCLASALAAGADVDVEEEDVLPLPFACFAVVGSLTGQSD